jgi:hypothetical protein
MFTSGQQNADEIIHALKYDIKLKFWSIKSSLNLHYMVVSRLYIKKLKIMTWVFFIGPLKEGEYQKSFCPLE